MTRPRSQSNPNPRRSRPPYTYTPLPSPRHIRLIRLLHYDTILSQAYITLTAHPIDAITHRFTALSYTWGSAIESFDVDPSPPLAPSPDPVELIIVPPDAFATFHRRDDLATTEGALLDAYTPDLRRLQVTGNLSDFFRAYLAGFPHRHLKPRGGDGRRLSFEQVAQLWIDAVCIDQGNADEKASQIPLMGEVYSLSGRVLGWLGADEKRLKVFCWWHRVVFPAIGRFVQEVGRAEGLLKLREGNFVDGRFWKDVVGFMEEPMGGHWATAWTDYWAFYRTRRYFHRVWIVQEVVVAGKFDTMAGMGSEELSWEEMTGFAYFLGHAGWIDVLNSLAGEMLSTEYTDAVTRGFGITDISGMQGQHQSRAFEESGWAEHWWGALSSVRRRDCFVQQDKVFATVGILQQALPKGTPLPFPVNATITPEEVYINAATTLLLNCPHLTLLSFVEHPYYRKLSNLPSWVPDLTTAKFPWPLGPFDTPFTACIPPSPTTPPNPPPPRTTTPTGELHLRGFRLDTITVKTPYEAPMNIRLAETVLQFLAALPLQYPHVTFPSSDRSPEGATLEGQFREAALVHTITCHEYSNVNRGTPDETGRVMVSFREWLLVALGQVYFGCLLRPGDEEYSVERVVECEGRWAEIERVIAGLERRVLVPGLEDLRVHGEQVAKAKRGEGPWPECVVSPQEFKDQVRRLMLYRCLFRTGGGPVPYVLRRREGQDGRVTFVFRGECYVHGVMNGELMKDSGEGKLEDVVLV
ncbi:heterokaryon incompatibility protein-domain-containing protein [Chaetomium tenue]|uniref:Heterokaryon incompatibility protein-domain-containing protein n=1 Tax=Chaetomium tenue TaxID=1854479 RepID=A0ACB7PMK0_9PEZI|nr:heterokaryon incompatibility protein-domain-containing protein [Chaetomium globosum]